MTSPESFGSRLAALFTSRTPARDSEDGSALLQGASSHDDAANENVVVHIGGDASPRRTGGSGRPVAPATTSEDATRTDGKAATKPSFSRASSSTSRESGGAPADESVRTDSSVNCLICLDPIDPRDTRNVVTLGCSCKGPAALRHKTCLDQWLSIKGDTKCDVCGADMHVPLPPPPPVPGWVVFPELEHTFEAQWATFIRYLWQNAVAVIVYCFVLALIMNIPLHIAMLIALVVLTMILLRYVVSVAVNAIARRTILSFQVPDSS